MGTHKKLKGQAEWVCENCNTLHIQTIIDSDDLDIMEVVCNECESTRTIQLLPVPESSFGKDWVENKCPQCSERKSCLAKENRKNFEKRIRLIEKLCFCEDYVVDHSQLYIDKRQVCREEATFDEIYNKGGFPLDERDTSEN